MNSKATTSKPHRYFCRENASVFEKEHKNIERSFYIDGCFSLLKLLPFILCPLLSPVPTGAVVASPCLRPLVPRVALPPPRVLPRDSGLPSTQARRPGRARRGRPGLIWVGQLARWRSSGF